MRRILFIFILSLITMGNAHASSKVNADQQVKDYAKLVYLSYKATYDDALQLQKAVDDFLANPKDENLANAKKSWVQARNSYGQTEAFRFYAGPIDFVDNAANSQGPENRLNAWPLNEAYIDYVQGAETAGIISNTTFEITKESIAKKNMQDDEADVTNGYHAIEFLLWGQDLSRDTAGVRPVTDYAKGDPIKERRRKYLAFTTAQLVDDLKPLVDSWESGKDNYAAKFIKQANKKALSKILTGLATMSGFELAAERMATALDSGDQEDEQSCFSDNTHNDFIANVKGIKNVYEGKYGEFRGASLYDLIKQADPALADHIKTQLEETEILVAALPAPIDREILASPKGSSSKEKMEMAVASLQKQANLFKQAGKILDAEVSIVTE